MKILFVTYDFPFPITSGGKNRAYNLIKSTSDKAEMHLFSFVRNDFQPDFIDEMKKIGIKNVEVFPRKKLLKVSNFTKTILNNSSIFKTLYFEKNAEEKLISYIKEHEIDIVHFESTYTGFFINSEISKMRVKTVLGMENIEFMLYEDYAKKKNFLLKPFIKQQSDRLKIEELKMVESADSTTAITKSEADIIEGLTKVKPSIVANGIDPKSLPFEFNQKEKNNILFVGNFTYFPNIDAVNFFHEEVFKNLDEKISLTIIGKKVKSKFGFNDPRIISKEFVDDLIPEYRNADILVFPVRIGGGTNFKVLEAMSLGVPIVAFPDRMSGLNAISGEHYLEAKSGEEFISQINKLYNDRALAQKIALSARKLVVDNFSWEKIGNDLIHVWKNLV